MNHASSSIEERLRQSREASYALATLSTARKNEVLNAFASLIEAHADRLLAENAKDIEAQAGHISASMFQRLKLDRAKLAQLARGIRDVATLADPVGRVLARTKLDTGLILVKQSVPLGVIGVIFESRPDVLPQIVSLALKSGNAAVLKGGKEAVHSNRAFAELAETLNQQFPWLPHGWVQLLDSREDVQEMLGFPQYVDLVIPRGSNALVQSIMAATKIPVMGHADGVCHLYVHRPPDLSEGIRIAIDAKAQYPAACNALETLLVDAAIAPEFLPHFAQAANAAGIALKGCPLTRQVLPNIETATEEDWRTEYGDLTLSIRVVDHPEAAIAHINRYGSHHTDAILTSDPVVQESFLDSVDSACVFANASTRFADGFRFGFGAEVGISTSKTHARGPVGLEGLVIYKYKLRGTGQVVADYVGEHPKPFLHEPLNCEEC